MGETTDEIKSQIDDQRHQLEENLEGIEGKLKGTSEQVQEKVQETKEQVQQTMKNATDWRHQFDQRPMLGLGIAFGGGMLLASMMGGGGGKTQGRNQSNYGYSYGYQPQYQSGQHQGYGNGGHSGAEVGKQHMSSTMDNIKGALMGVAAAQAKSFLGQSVPSFDDEYSKVESENTSGGSSGSQKQTSDGMSQSASYPAHASDRHGVGGDQ